MLGEFDCKESMCTAFLNLLNLIFFLHLVVHMELQTLLVPKYCRCKCYTVRKSYDFITYFDMAFANDLKL